MEVATTISTRGVARPATTKAGVIEVFRYPACPGAEPVARNGWVDPQDDGETSNPAQYRAHGPHARADEATFNSEFAEETTRAFEAGRERGRQEERETERAVEAAARREEEERRKRQLAKLVEDFGAERDRYLEAVEHEVVKLALAIAARILRREAQMDPLLLTGAVRVALGQLAGATEVQLRVPAAERDLWTEAIAMLPNLAIKPTVVAGEEMRLGDCVIDSKVGTVDLGMRSQLAEIERGFFDRIGSVSEEIVYARRSEGKKELA